jgi:glycine cleavage system aminomethyltransferase T/glycine/D-amino acid oxidase-like deaminating enzyme
MNQRARIVIIGAGIVGSSAAWALMQAGWRDILVLDQGPLPRPGGSTSHAPGLVFQTNTSQTMCRLAQQSVALYRSLGDGAGSCFIDVGSLEVAGSAERWRDLHRRVGYARAWGLEAELITPQQAADRVPLIDPDQIHGAYAVPSDGLARAVRACELIAAALQRSGAGQVRGATRVTGLVRQGSRVVGVTTEHGDTIACELVLICGGIWGPLLGRLAGVAVPLTPVEHQYVRTTPLAGLADARDEATHPIVRHQDAALYMRQVGACYGVGSYRHAPLLVAPEAIRPVDDWRRGVGEMPSSHPFTPDAFAGPWRAAQALMPPLRTVAIDHAFNGMFSFTPDGLPLVGPAPGVPGLWLAEAVWVTHGGGVGRAVAEWIVDGRPQCDLRECDIARFERHAASPAYVRERGAQQYREVYDIIHPAQPLERPRPLRTSPFYLRQLDHGAVFLEGRGWERAQWYETNRGAPEADAAPPRDAWTGAFWSPAVVAEQLATRQRVGLYDMTSLVRAELEGPGAAALLARLTTGRVARPVGSVSYTLMCDHAGGVRSDITVTRCDAERYQLGLNGPQDLAWIRQHLPDDRSVSLREITGATCCLAVWGPRARAVLQSLSDDDFSPAFRYMTAREVFIAEVPCLAQRISYVGELGWELYASAEYGVRLWDVLWQAGQPHGMVVAGRGAFDALRLEKGYRSWGSDLSTDQNPFEAGLGWAVRPERDGYIGAAALRRLAASPPARRLCALRLDRVGQIVLGREALCHDGRVVGYVTSAAYAATLGASIAYGYLPAALAEPGTRLTVMAFEQPYGATVMAEPMFDPSGARMRD